MQQASISRRTFVRGAVGAAAGLGVGATLPLPATARRARAAHRDPVVPPKPIPGGIQIPDGPLIHVHAPGPPDVTLPFSGLTLEGLDVEPSTLTDFRGFSAVAYEVGTATDREGTTYNLEADVRAFQGAYVDATGTRRFGTFAFI
jgi:hypothetical protein